MNFAEAEINTNTILEYACFDPQDAIVFIDGCKLYLEKNTGNAETVHEWMLLVLPLARPDSFDSNINNGDDHACLCGKSTPEKLKTC